MFEPEKVISADGLNVAGSVEAVTVRVQHSTGSPVSLKSTPITVHLFRERLAVPFGTSTR